MDEELDSQYDKKFKFTKELDDDPYKEMPLRRTALSALRSKQIKDIKELWSNQKVMNYIERTSTEG